MKKNSLSPLTLMLFYILSLFFFLTSLQAEKAFIVTASLEKNSDSIPVLIISFNPTSGYFYADKIKVELISPEETTLEELPSTPPSKKQDPFLKEEVLVYETPFLRRYKLSKFPMNQILSIKVRFQGCEKDTCYLPETKNFRLSLNGRVEPDYKHPNIAQPQSEIPGQSQTEHETQAQPLAPANLSEKWTSSVKDFIPQFKMVGYLKADEFIRILKDPSSLDNSDFKDIIKEKGLLLSIILILLGGAALNLTPCVLPMIPINVAIIGAGVHSSSKFYGFLRGLIYGAGIALSYGILGLTVIFSGATFGMINSSPWFNAFISIVFIMLSLAMFGRFNLDFSRYQPDLISQRKKGGWLLPLIMGSISALLAGACVAPVVIAVLLLSSQLYAEGQYFGLFLPFVLGLGMALPWPFAGAGISFLPKPGDWMETVKKAFAFIILLFAAYYGYESYLLFKNNPSGSPQHPVTLLEQGWISSLEEGFQKADAEDKPVFLDFYASWCKNCVAMEKTTFKNEKVIEQLNKYIKIKFSAEYPNDPGTKKVLEYFGVIGLPTFIVLEKKDPAVRPAEKNPDFRG